MTDVKDITDKHQYMKDAWAPIMEDMALDIKAASADPWPDREKQARSIAGQERPMLVFNEIEQHLNAAINEISQQDRAIEVTPEGNGANDKTAELKSNLIRRIEYRSKAKSAYLGALADAMRGSLGYFRAGAEYASIDSFDQEMYISKIPNPATVRCDPDARKAAWSDMQYAQIYQDMAIKEFKKKFPSATITDFDEKDMALAPGWVKGERIMLAEHWQVEKKAATLYRIDWEIMGPNGIENHEQIIRSTMIPKGFVVESGYLVLPGGHRGRIAQERPIEVPDIWQYLTNGVEILKKTPWKGSWIPIFPVTGREVFSPPSIDLTNSMRREFLSLVRYARDPQMLLNYYRTTESEVVGMTPKTPFLAVVGQLDGFTDDWAAVNKAPLPVLYYRAKTTETGPEQILPPPSRQPYEPAIQALEMGAESARRAIMAAMGMNNTSVGRSDSNARSGVALRELKAQTSMGIWHFKESLDMAIEQCGLVIEEQLQIRYAREGREVNITKPGGGNERVKLGMPPGEEQEDDTRLDQGTHGVTISVGMSFDSQREAVDDLGEQIIAMPNCPPAAIGKVIRMKNLGKLADELADVFEPPSEDKLPPEVRQTIEAQKQQIQELDAFAKKLHSELESKNAELAAKLEMNEENNRTKLIVEEMKQQGAAAQALLMAELQQLHMRIDSMTKRTLLADQQTHESVEAEAGRAHESQEAAANRDHATEQQGAEHEVKLNLAEQQAKAKKASE